jgi:hypothetical protein
MILRYTTHKTSTDVVVVHAGPELAEFMGAFPAARWQPKSKTYWYPTAQLDVLERHATRCGHVLVDDRKDADEREKFVGPLPECSACGQPAARSTSGSLSRCPACGAEWRPVVADTPAATGTWSPRVECPVCGRRQRDGWAYCGGCGAPAIAAPRGPRPEHVERPKLAEPALFGDLADEVLADLDERQLEDDDRDFAQRAAGDR